MVKRIKVPKKEIYFLVVNTPFLLMTVVLKSQVMEMTVIIIVMMVLQMVIEIKGKDHPSTIDILRGVHAVLNVWIQRSQGLVMILLSVLLLPTTVQRMNHIVLARRIGNLSRIMIGKVKKVGSDILFHAIKHGNVHDVIALLNDNEVDIDCTNING